MPPARKRQPSPASRGTFPLPGSVVDNKYVVEEEIGSGGMGVVVAARHVGLQQRFAIKFLVYGIDDPDTVQRFVREARAASELKSEHVVRVSDVGELPSGQPYLVMEYLDGEDLGSLLEGNGPLRITEAVGFILQACEALAEAHSRGIVHRDLKPGNLFLTTRPDGTAQIKVVDFGVSKIESRGDPNLHMTEGRSTLGSPYYMSPEQIRSASQVDARSDIWAMGVTLYELLTGQRAFDAPTMPALAAKIVSDPYTPARQLRSALPPGIEAILRKCLAKDPEMRFQSVAELASALAPFAGSDARIAARRAVRIRRHSAPDESALADPKARAAALPAIVGSSHAGMSLEVGGPDDPVSDDLSDTRAAPDSQSVARARRSQRVLWAVLVAVALSIVGIGIGVRVLTREAVPVLAGGAMSAPAGTYAAPPARLPELPASASASSDPSSVLSSPTSSAVPSAANPPPAQPSSSSRQPDHEAESATPPAKLSAPVVQESPAPSATAGKGNVNPLLGRH